MTSVHQSASPVVESQVSLAGDDFSQPRQLSFDDVESLDEWLGAGDYSHKVLLSLADLATIDTRRIGWLVTTHKRFVQDGGKLIVHSIRRQAMETVRFLGLDRVLDVADSQADALGLV